MVGSDDWIRCNHSPAFRSLIGIISFLLVLKLLGYRFSEVGLDLSKIQFYLKGKVQLVNCSEGEADNYLHLSFRICRLQLGSSMPLAWFATFAVAVRPCSSGVLSPARVVRRGTL